MLKSFDIVITLFDTKNITELYGHNSAQKVSFWLCKHIILMLPLLCARKVFSHDFGSKTIISMITTWTTMVSVCSTALDKREESITK